MRRSQPDHTVPGETDDVSSHEESSVRRPPRVGSQFQTRISKSTGFTIRPTPERMSVDFPYISEKEAGESDEIQSNVFEFKESKVGFTSKSGFDLTFNDSKSRRGGLLVHKPAKEMGEFFKYVQPFVISSRNQVRPTITNEAWIQHMIHLHSTETTGKRNRASRGGVKRKRAESEEMIWNLENILNNLKKNRCQVYDPGMLGEEEATALEHLRLFFDGNIDAAEFSALVNLSGGQAFKMRKREERERRRRKLKVPSQQTSDSWRDMYQSFTLPYRRTVLGQLQDDDEPLYVMQKNTSQALRNKSDEHANVNLVLEPDDSKGAWRSILACAKSIERQLNSESLGPGDKRPLLSTLLTFVGKAHDLPAPESCFGTHHVMIEEVSNTIISILNHVKEAQNAHAKIRDKMFNESEEGINSDDLLKFLDTEYSGLPIRLKEVDELYRFRDTVVLWESRLLKVLSVTEEELEHKTTENYLRIAEEMQHEARSHGYRSKALVQLTARINKAYDLRDRILKWKCAGIHGKMTTIRTLSGFVKEAKRTKLFSPEVLEIYECHRLAEEWIDRANIAIRSKISLLELKNLIQRGEEMSLDLSEYIDKLKTRVRIADDWLEALDEIVPFKNNSYSSLEIWHKLEASLQNGNHNGLHDLSSEGNRIPVDIVAVKLLQLALDAKNWTTKALKWIPDNVDSKKGKLSDLREHLDKVSSLREKLPLPEIDKKRWKPISECELSAIIVAADSWMEKYNAFLAGDNRKSDQRSCLSITKLRTIVDEGNDIYSNIGNSVSKISRILSQAEKWYNSHLSLLQHCGISLKDGVIETSPKPFITIQEMSAAVEAARMDVSLDLDEAMELRKILSKSRSWNERVTLIAPKRNKRHSRGSRSKFRLEDLIWLIEEASNLPIDTNESVNRLQIQLNEVEIWRSEALKALQDILIEFGGLKSHVQDVYGEAKEYSIERISDSCDSDEESVNYQRGESSSISLNTDTKDHVEGIDTNGDKAAEAMGESISGSEEDVQASDRGSNSALTVFRLIRELKEETKDISVITAEGEIGELLDTVSKWCIKSFKYLNTPREVFDKRFFGAFDRFITEGENLCVLSFNSESHSNSSDRLSERLFGAWGSVVRDQLLRLTILKREREKFEAWCKHASRVLSDEKKLTAQKLADLAKSSRHFPANRDLVSKIRGLSVKVSKWTEKARNLFESRERIDAQDARILVETGEKLKVQTEELKRLKAEIRLARNWSNRAKKCNVEQGSIHVNDVKELIVQHDGLLIEMPDELEVLKQATIGYCICRRPYEGFMIGCDHCDEWYHGSCIGISESKADRVEKFTCVRCSTKKIFNNSAIAAVGIIRKWTCPKDFKKARQIEFQKFQRKDRKEKKDIEKFSNQIKNLQDQLSDLKRNDKCSRENDITMDLKGKPSDGVVFGPDSVQKKTENRAEQSDNPSANIVSVENGKLTNATNDRSQLTSDETTTVKVTKNKVEMAPMAHEIEPMKRDESEVDFCSSSEVSKTKTNGISGVFLNEGEIVSKVDKARISLQQSKDRLKKTSNQSQQRTLIEAEEDKHSNALRYWCLKVRSEVFAPSVDSQSEIARPSPNGSMSPVMKQIVIEAEHLGIINLSDVKRMVGCLKSLCWSFSAMGVLRRKPLVSEVRHLVSEASTFKLPDEKALRTMKLMTNKASQLQTKVEKALYSKKAVSKPINISLLQELQSGIRESPLVLPEEEILRVVIEDGKFSERKVLESKVKEFKGSHCKSIHLKEDVSPHAPNPIELWPPFGLQHSQEAITAFGSECLAIQVVKIADVEAATQRSEVLSGCPLSSQAHLRERTAFPVETNERHEESSKKKSSICVEIKKNSMEATVSHVSSELDALSSSLATSNNNCTESTIECDSGIQIDILKTGHSPLNLISKSSQSYYEQITHLESSHESCQRSGGPSISIVASNMTSHNQSKNQQKDKTTTSNPSIPTLTSNTTICHDQSESQPKDENTTTNPSIFAMPSNNTKSHSQSDSHTKGETGTVDPSISTNASNSVRHGQVDGHTKDETRGVDLSFRSDAFSSACHSQLGSHTEDQTSAIDPSLRSDTTNSACHSQSKSHLEDQTSAIDPSLRSDTSNSGCHSQLKYHLEDESSAISLRRDTSNSSCDSELTSHRENETSAISSSIPSMMSNNTTLSDNKLETHPKAEAGFINPSILNVTSNSAMFHYQPEKQPKDKIEPFDQSIPTATSSSNMSHSNLVSHPKNEPQTFGPPIETVTANSTTSDNNFENYQKDEPSTLCLPIPTVTSNITSDNKSEIYQKDEPQTMLPAAPIETSNAAASDSKLESYPKDEPQTIVPPTRTAISNIIVSESTSESYQKDEPQTTHSTVPTETSNTTASDSKLESYPKDETQTMHPTVPTETSNTTTGDSKLESYPQDESETIVSSTRAEKSNTTAVDSKLESHLKDEPQIIGPKIPTNTSNNVCNSLFDSHHKEEAEKTPPSSPTNTSNRPGHGHSDSHSKNEADAIVDKSLSSSSMPHSSATNVSVCQSKSENRQSHETTHMEHQPKKKIKLLTHIER